VTGSLVPAAVLAMIAELATATKEIINRHWDQDEALDPTERTLAYYEGLQVRLYSEDGPLAFFWDDGVEVLPKEDKK
jgi:hypothetical protein